MISELIAKYQFAAIHSADINRQQSHKSGIISADSEIPGIEVFHVTSHGHVYA